MKKQELESLISVADRDLEILNKNIKLLESRLKKLKNEKVDYRR